jgi:DNA-entry nuclease
MNRGKGLLLATLLLLACLSLAACTLETDGGSTASVTSGGMLTQEIPAYSGAAYTELNGNTPDFAQEDLTTQSFESYSELDSLGRCGVAYANIGQDLMPTEARGAIGMVKPSGWQTVRYDGVVDGNYLYNRCHLIGYQLSGENANKQNLITGTRYLNVTGMLPFENQVADYVEETGNHVLYRVTPLFLGDDLVAQGVQMEALSVEDGGQGVCFNVFVYNIQPGVVIDYSNGDSWLEDSTSSSGGDTLAAETATDDTEPTDTQETWDETQSAGEETYVLNTSSMVFHAPSCASAAKMQGNNREDYTGTREDIVEQGFSPCGRCKP